MYNIYILQLQETIVKKKYTWYRPRWWREARVNIQLVFRDFMRYKEKHPEDHVTEPERF